MITKNTYFRWLAVVLFSAGVILGTFLFGVMTWSDFEATLFDSLITEDSRIHTACPVIIGMDEVGKVKINIKNPLDTPIKNRIIFRSTDGTLSLINEIRERYDLEPGEKLDLEWTVESNDAVFNDRLILVKVRTDPTYPLDSKQGSCGVLVADFLGLPGIVIFLLVVLASVILMVAGISLWQVRNKPLSKKKNLVYRAMSALIILITAGIFVSYFGWWLIGAILLIITILAIGGIIAYFISA